MAEEFYNYAQNFLPQTIVVEGNIGAGKSEFLKIFQNHTREGVLSYQVLEEPVNMWQNFGGQNVFRNFAYYPYRWSFTFQMLTMISLFKNESCNGHKIMERSMFSSRFIFAEALKQTNNMVTVKKRSFISIIK